VERLQESVVVDAPPFSIDLCTKDRLFTLSVDTEQEMLLWALALLTAAPRLAPPVAGAAKAATPPKAKATPPPPGAVEVAAAGAAAKAAALSVPEPPVPAAAEAATMVALEAEMAAALAPDSAKPAAPPGASSAAAIEVVSEAVAQDIDSLALLVAARLKGKVDSLWAAMPKDANGSIERLACWAVLLADAELADLVGSGDAAKGKQ
jgi:hypothetical protein